MDAILGANPLFSAGAGLIGLTAGLALMTKGAGRAAEFAKRRLLVSLEIPSKDLSYQWFLGWMARNSKIDLTRRKSFMDRIIPKSHHQLAVETTFMRRENGSVISEFSLVPGQGKHFLKYKNAWFQVERRRERTMLDLKSGTPWETLTITTLSRDRKLFNDMLTEARTDALEKEVGKTCIFTSFGPEWRLFGSPRQRRPISSVVLDKGISETLLADVKKFLSGGQWYHDRGIPYRRGYLLHGPPGILYGFDIGSGKTSFIQSLAGELEYNICLLNLSERGMTDDRLAHLMNNIPPGSLLLLEDIDAAFPSRESVTPSSQKYSSSLTFSGLLNALDGVAASEERIIFMTTNHVERLDAALIRPGRVDQRMYIGNATETQAYQMFLRFYPNDELAARFCDNLNIHRVFDGKGRLSTAQLQAHFVLHREDADAASTDIDRLISEQYK